jgi:hypothetical protein
MMELEQALASLQTHVRNNERGEMSSQQDQNEINSEDVIVEMLAPNPTNSEYEFHPIGNLIFSLLSNVTYIFLQYTPKKAERRLSAISLDASVDTDVAEHAKRTNDVFR